MQASAAPVLAVVDGDMQHDESVLPAMIDQIERGEADLVVGTRYAGEGSTGDWDQQRESLSRAATWLSQKVIRTEVSDPMSGFFAVSRKAFEEALPNLSKVDRKSTRLNSSHKCATRMPYSACKKKTTKKTQ